MSVLGKIHRIFLRGCFIRSKLPQPRTRFPRWGKYIRVTPPFDGCVSFPGAPAQESPQEKSIAVDSTGISTKADFSNIFVDSRIIHQSHLLTVKNYFSLFALPGLREFVPDNFSVTQPRKRPKLLLGNRVLGWGEKSCG